MNNMINNFRIPQLICTSHSEPCQYMLIDNYKMKLICYRCLPLYPVPTPQSSTKILPIEHVRDYITAIVSNQEGKLVKCSMTDIHKLIQERKKEIDQKQYRVLEQVMKKLTEDKQKMYAELDILQKYFQGQEVKYQFNIEQRDHIIKYLKEFCIDDNLFRLKLMVSNEFGLNSFMAQVRSLQLLGQEFKNRNNALFMAQMDRQIKIKQEASFLNHIQTFLKKPVEQKLILPIKIGIPKQKCNYTPQITQRRNQSHQNIQIMTPSPSPRTSRQHSFAQLPRLVIN